MVAFGGAALLLPAPAGATTQAFTTPGTVTFPVPAGVTSVDLVVTGAHGGNGATGSNAGNSGGVVTVTGVPVTPCTTLAILVGGHGTDGITTTAGTGETGGGGGGGFFGGGGGGGGSQFARNLVPLANVTFSQASLSQADGAVSVTFTGGSGTCALAPVVTAPIVTAPRFTV